MGMGWLRVLYRGRHELLWQMDGLVPVRKPRHVRWSRSTLLSHYNAMPLPQLKKECGDYWLEKDGLKQDLVERLVEYRAAKEGMQASVPTLEQAQKARDEVLIATLGLSPWGTGFEAPARECVWVRVADFTAKGREGTDALLGLAGGSEGRRVRIASLGSGRVAGVQKSWLNWALGGPYLQHRLQLDVSDGGTLKTIPLATSDNNGRGISCQVEQAASVTAAQRRKARTRRLAQLAETYLGDALEQQGTSLRRAFEEMDVHGDHKLSLKELQKCLLDVTGRTLRRADLRELVASVDESGDNTVDWQEFVQVFRRAEHARKLASSVSSRLAQISVAQRGNLLPLFESFDTNRDGILTQDELLRGLRGVGIRLRDTQMAEIMSVIDGDGSGGIDYSEFVTAVNDAGRVRNKFAEMPRNELERACREHSLTSSGTNQALVERLVQAELIATRRHTAAVSGASGTEIIWVNGLQWTDDEIVGQRIRLNEARNESGLVQEFKKGWLSNSHVVKWEDSRLSQEVELRTKQNATSGRYFELARQGVAASQKLHEDRGTKLFRLCSANMRTTLIARLEELELALRRGDAAGTGRLTPRQCQNVLHDVAGSGLGFRELKELMATVDEFGDDEVDWKQFLAVVKRARRSQRQVGTSLLQRFRDELVSRGDDLEKTFRDFDTDGDGALDAGELLDGLKQLGVTPTRSEVAELMAVADEDEDNTIDYYEFITLLKGPAHSGSSALSTDSSQRAIQQEQLKSELMKSSLSQLRQKCEDQGLTTDGLKNNLVARLIQSPRESANSATQSPRVRRARARRLIHVVAAEIGQQMKSGESLEDVFVAMDKDGNGKLSTSELQAGIRKMTGRTIGKQGLQDLVQLVDDNENNSVDWKEFVTLYKTAERDQIDATEVMRRARTKLRERGLSCREAFEGFDADDNGKIDREELRVGLRKLGVSLGDEQLKGLMSVVDKNSDGAVDLDEFVAIMQGNGGASEFVKSGSARRRYATMDLADLARECRHRGVPDDGLKADLIARLMKWQDSADDGYYDLSTGEVDNSAGSSPDMTNTIWVDGATVSGKDLAPTRPGDVGCTIDVEGYGRGSVLEFQNNRIRRVYRHVVKMFATGEVHTLSLRTGDNPRGGNIDFRLAQGETHSQQRHRGGAPQICEIQKAPPPTNFGMVISATGIVDRHTGRNARDAGVPLRGMITHVNGHSVNGKGDIVAAIRGVEVGERVRFQIETALGDWVPGETEYDANLLDRRIDILGKGIGRVRQVKPSRFGTRTPTEHTVDLEGRGPGGGGGQRIKVSLRSSENAALDRECKTTKRFLIQLTVSETNTRQATKRARRVAENVTPRERESLIRCSLSLEERMRNHSAEERLVDFDAFSGILSGITKRSVSVARLEQSFGEAVMANMQGSDEQEPLFDWMEFCAIFCRAYRGQRLAALLQTHHGDTLKRRETELQEMCESAVTIPGANWLQWEDLRRVLGHFGVKPTKPELEQLSTTVDVDGKLPIDFHELLKAIGGRGFGESSGAMTPREQRARLEGMQLQDLKAECRRYGLQDAGLRSELISRLVAAVGQSTTGQDGTGIGEDHDDDDEADVVWLPGETFPADDLAGRHVHVRGFGRGQVCSLIVFIAVYCNDL
jgi:Ca2+-binding EF-hand superfamily protein